MLHRLPTIPADWSVSIIPLAQSIRNIRRILSVYFYPSVPPVVKATERGRRVRGAEAISTETMIAVVSGVATREEHDRVFAAALTDPDLRLRLALESD